MSRTKKAEMVVEDLIVGENEESKKEEKILTSEVITEGATNNPIFSKDSIVLADGKTYKIIHLEFDDYMAFLTLLSPAFEGMLGAQAVSTTKLDVLKIIELCKTNLPELGRLVLKQTKSDITIEEVKKLCPTPFKMGELVLLQIHHNEMIKDFSSFFPQILSLVQR